MLPGMLHSAHMAAAPPFPQVIALKKVPQTPRKDRPIRIPIPHPIYSTEDAEICLFVKDHKGGLAATRQACSRCAACTACWQRCGDPLCSASGAVLRAPAPEQRRTWPVSTAASVVPQRV
jgi:hypothetical protein